MNPEKADFAVRRLPPPTFSLRAFGVAGPMARGPGDDGSTAIDEEEGKDASTRIAYLCEHRGGSGSAGMGVTALKPTEWPEQLALDF
jgi:hypothetical protein